MTYADYLQSPEWKRRRNERLGVARYTCHRCAATQSLQVHHVEYVRLGAELDADLEVVCSTCHEGHHFEASRKQHLGVYVKLVSDAIRAGADTSFADLAEAVRLACHEHQVPADPVRIARAINAAGSNRLKPDCVASPAAPIRSDPRPVGRAEAAAIVRTLGVLVPFKSFPKAASLEPGAVDAFREACGLWSRP